MTGVCSFSRPLQVPRGSVPTGGWTPNLTYAYYGRPELPVCAGGSSKEATKKKLFFKHVAEEFNHNLLCCKPLLTVTSGARHRQNVKNVCLRLGSNLSCLLIIQHTPTHTHTQAVVMSVSLKFFCNDVNHSLLIVLPEIIENVSNFTVNGELKMMIFSDLQYNLRWYYLLKALVISLLKAAGSVSVCRPRPAGPNLIHRHTSAPTTSAIVEFTLSWVCLPICNPLNVMLLAACWGE